MLAQSASLMSDVPEETFHQCLIRLTANYDGMLIRFAMEETSLLTDLRNLAFLVENSKKSVWRQIEGTWKVAVELVACDGGGYLAAQGGNKHM